MEGDGHDDVDARADAAINELWEMGSRRTWAREEGGREEARVSVSLLLIPAQGLVSQRVRDAWLT